MTSIVRVTGAATAPYRLTTLDRIKAELEISGTASDVLLAAKVDEAGSDIEAYLNFRVARETVTETFRGVRGDDCLILNRTPVAAIASVVLDDVALAAEEYEVDAGAGLLYRVDSSGRWVRWYCSKSIIVAYGGGYILPGNPGASLEPAIESACIDLVTSYWRSRGRDQTIKSEEIPGVMRVDYWVGSVGEAGELPPGVVAKLAPFRRASA